MYDLPVYTVFIEILDIVFLTFWGYCLCFFFGSYLCLRRRFLRRGRNISGIMPPKYAWTEPVRTGWPLWVFWVLWKRLSDALIEVSYNSVEMLCKQVAVYGVLFFFMTLLYTGRREVVLYVSVTFTAVSEICRFLAYSTSLLGNWLYSLGQYMLEQEKIKNLEGYVTLLVAHSAIVQLLMNVVFGVCLYGTLRYIRNTLGGESLSLDRTERNFLLLPGCTGLLFCVFLRVIMVTMEDQQPRFLFDKYPVLIGVMPALLILCLYSILYSVKLFRQLRELHEQKNRALILEQQLESMEEHLRETERVYAGVRAMKHDMKNQLAVMTELAERQEAGSQLRDYLAQMNRTMGGLDFPYSTGNPVVDTLLAIKYHEMQERIPGILFEAEQLIIPGNLKVRPMDLNLILGNGLDNAIEACERMLGREADGRIQEDLGDRTEAPKIRVSTMMKGSFFLLEIENTFDGRLNCPAGREFPQTSKEDSTLHGIGLRSIRDTALKYHGGVDWNAEDGAFTLTVMLKNGDSVTVRPGH